MKVYILLFLPILGIFSIGKCFFLFQSSHGKIATVFGEESLNQLYALLSLPVYDGGFFDEKLKISYYDIKSLQKKLNPLETPAVKKCAVVGSSFSIFNEANGHIIDAANMIIRINNAPVSDAMKMYLGSRTTFYINTFPDLRPLSRLTNKPTDQFIVNGSKVIYYCHVPRMSKCWTNIVHDKVARLSPHLVQKMKEDLNLSKPHWPSSGIMAIAFALQKCKSVNIFGFDKPHVRSSYKCAKYYHGSFKTCAEFPNDRCVIFKTNDTRHTSKCLNSDRYLQNFYHNWTSEMSLIAKLHRMNILKKYS